jgi:hypothetical protein
MTDIPNPPSPFIQALRRQLKDTLDDTVWTLGGRDRSLWAEHRTTTAAISSQGFKAQLWAARRRSGAIRCTLEIEDQKQGQVPPEVVAQRDLIAGAVRAIAFENAMMDGVKPSKGSTVARLALSTNDNHLSESILKADIDRVKRFCLLMNEALLTWLQQDDGGLADNVKVDSASYAIVSHAPRQLDPWLRCQIEKTAVSKTIAQFESKGYRVQSQEKDNVGWDLLATRGEEQLLLEVKGLASNSICFELTPNEYEQLQEQEELYRICVVTAALTNPELSIYKFNRQTQSWQDESQRELEIKPLVAARCRLRR